MLHQPYSAVYPLTWLLRRMLASDCPIALIPTGIAFMIAHGEIEMPGPRDQLPAKWDLVVLSTGPRAGQLLIMTEESSRLLDPREPLDPNQFLCRERLHDPMGVIPWPETRFMRARRAKITSRLVQLLAEDPDALKGDDEIEAAKWLASKLKPDDSVLRNDHKAECMERHKLISERGYERRVWPAARYLMELPEEREPGRPKQK